MSKTLTPIKNATPFLGRPRHPRLPETPPRLPGPSRVTAAKAARARALPARPRQDAARPGPGSLPRKPTPLPRGPCRSRSLAGLAARLALHTATGARKYLTVGERYVFL